MPFADDITSFISTCRLNIDFDISMTPPMRLKYAIHITSICQYFAQMLNNKALYNTFSFDAKRYYILRQRKRLQSFYASSSRKISSHDAAADAIRHELLHAII